MTTNALSLAPIVSIADPAQVPGPGPVTGKHVTLERLAQKHFSDLYENIGLHPDLWTWWPDDAPSTAAQFDDYLVEFSNLMKEDLAVYAIILLSGPSKGKAAGLAMALSEDRLTNRVGEMGFFFGPLLQRSRAGTEAVYLVCNLLFESNHRRVGWKTNSLNIQSRKAAERYGLSHEGTIRQHQINKGRNRDTAFYGIIDSEWLVGKKAFEIWLDDENFDEHQRQKRRLEVVRGSLKENETSR